MKDSILKALGVLGFVIGAWVLFYGPLGIHSNGATKFGAAFSGSGMLAENYIPYVLYNGGYNSAKDIATTGNINGAIGTFSSSVGITGSLTLSSLLGFTSTVGTSNVQIVSAALTAATTTPCNLQNPFSATSTVTNIVFNVTTATSAPSQMVIATSTAKNATTSAIAFFGTGISNQITYVMSEATSTGQTPVTVSSGWLVIGSTATSSIPYTTNGVYTFGGNCEATFQSVL